MTPTIATRITSTGETRLVVAFPPTFRALSRDHQRRLVEDALVQAQAQVEASLADDAPLSAGETRIRVTA